MKLLFLIPVTAEYENKKTDILSYLQPYLHPDTVIEFAQIPQGYTSIESDLQDIYNGWQTVNLVKTLSKSYDGIYVNCFDDPECFVSTYEVYDVRQFLRRISRIFIGIMLNL